MFDNVFVNRLVKNNFDTIINKADVDNKHCKKYNWGIDFRIKFEFLLKTMTMILILNQKNGIYGYFQLIFLYELKVLVWRRYYITSERVSGLDLATETLYTIFKLPAAMSERYGSLFRVYKLFS